MFGKKHYCFGKKAGGNCMKFKRVKKKYMFNAYSTHVNHFWYEYSTNACPCQCGDGDGHRIYI